MVFDSVYGNPAINFDEQIVGAYPQNVINFNGMGAVKSNSLDYYSSRTPTVQEVILTNDIFEEVSECDTHFAATTGNPEDPVFASWNGKYWIHDPRFLLQENTVENPLPDGGGALVEATKGNYQTEMSVSCSAAPRTFVNEGGCRQSFHENLCSSNKVADVKVELSYANLKKIYDVTGGRNITGTRYLYAIDNLRLNGKNPSPCMPLSTSRWVKGVCDGSGPPIEEQTREAMVTHLSNSNDNNRYMRDILMPSRGMVCNGSDLAKRGIEIMVDGDCWKNVHPQHLQVYDMTYWTERATHPGNMVSDREPIKEIAWNDSFTLFYPRSSHGMDRWEEHERHFDNIGRLGDSVAINTFPETLLTFEVAKAFDALNLVRGSSSVVCGTPGEVQNNLFLGGDTERGGFDAVTRHNRTTPEPTFARQRNQVWTTIALESADQLRQRMAWALSQILVVSPDTLEETSTTEAVLSYYDIFVRHAFGNYRDILLEVSYSPMMAEMLTYIDSKSTSYQWEASEGTKLEFPDENMAREIMQLFTTGLYKMRRDGNLILDESGNPVRVYRNDDIEEYSRMWTGFRRQAPRGNVEGFSNRIDPMFIEPAW